MEVIFPRCAGLDVHEAFVVVCCRILGPDGHLDKVVRRYSTMTADLLALGDWLSERGVTHVTAGAVSGECHRARPRGRASS